MPFYGQRGERKVVRYSAEHAPLHRSAGFLFFYLPSQCHFGLQTPRRVKCIKPLTVFTCVGLMLMCEGRPEDEGWDIDHRRMSAGGTAFHAWSSENPSSRNSVASETTAARHLCSFRRAHFTWSRLFRLALNQPDVLTTLVLARPPTVPVLYRAFPQAFTSK